MTNRFDSDRTCPHLPRSYFSNLGDNLWCVRCDGAVTDEGVVIPRGHVAKPPANRAYGAKLERFLGKELSLRRGRAPRMRSRSA